VPAAPRRGGRWGRHVLCLHMYDAPPRRPPGRPRNARLKRSTVEQHRVLTGVQHLKMLRGHVLQTYDLPCGNVRKLLCPCLSEIPYLRKNLCRPDAKCVFRTHASWWCRICAQTCAELAPDLCRRALGAPRGSPTFPNNFERHAKIAPRCFTNAATCENTTHGGPPRPPCPTAAGAGAAMCCFHTYEAPPVAPGRPRMEGPT
jgi:hypothetical protein